MKKQLKDRAKNILLTGVGLFVGIALGGYLFSDTQPRSILTFTECAGACFEERELLGLIASVGIQKSPVLPLVVLETDKTVAIRHPRPESPQHFVIIPKRDIKNIGELSEEDSEYYWDALAVAQKIIRDNNLGAYQFLTNGPVYQDVTYLHFHLQDGAE